MDAIEKRAYRVALDRIEAALYSCWPISPATADIHYQALKDTLKLIQKLKEQLSTNDVHDYCI